MSIIIMEVITIRKTFVRFIRTYKEEYSFQKTKNAIISRRGEQISYIRRKKINEEKIYWKVRDYDYFIEKSGATGLIRSLKAQNIFL